MFKQLVIQSSMREAAKLYSDGSIGERKSASGAARVGERSSSPILKRHGHSQAKSLGREIGRDFRADLLRQHPFEEHRAKPVAAARRHWRFREFAPFAQ